MAELAEMCCKKYNNHGNVCCISVSINAIIKAGLKKNQTCFFLVTYLNEDKTVDAER